MDLNDTVLERMLKIKKLSWDINQTMTNLRKEGLTVKIKCDELRISSISVTKDIDI